MRPAPRAVFRLAFYAVFLLCAVYTFVLYVQPRFLPPALRLGDQSWRLIPLPHPIDDLIKDNHARLGELLGNRSSSVAEATARYRERRGRHPPPGFDAWFQAAHEANAVVVEQFFDRIYHDIGPLWALDPAEMRRQTHTQPQVIRVRNGSADFVTDNPNRTPWIQHWTQLVAEIAEHLPDLDMVVNVMDETRLLVPWDRINTYMQKEQATRKLAAPNAVVAAYSGLADVDGNAAVESRPYEHSWITNDANRFWNHLRDACAPGTPGRKVDALASFAEPVEFPGAVGPAYSYKGFIANITAARDPCMQPHLRGLHGTFIESVSMSTSHDLMPMFAGCKLPQNNEILIPGAMYLTEDPFYSGGASHGVSWAKKTTGMVWRGTASGGRNKVDNWWHFHRHRWVQMANGSTVQAAIERFNLVTPTFRLPSQMQLEHDYPSLGARRSLSDIGQWVDSFADVGFVDLECFPLQHDAEGGKVLTCQYTSPLLEVHKPVPMEAQYNHKFLPDVDGNSYSARWRSFLRSTSLPLKATIYAEWHDDRLVPWVHYVPFDNTYLDIYAVMDYFLEDAEGVGHDAAAKRIADEGRAWAEAVLRREDMQLYVWRLLLEYARVVDDKRELLGFVGDLV